MDRWNKYCQMVRKGCQVMLYSWDKKKKSCSNSPCLFICLKMAARDNQI